MNRARIEMGQNLIFSKIYGYEDEDEVEKVWFLNQFFKPLNTVI